MAEVGVTSPILIPVAWLDSSRYSTLGPHPAATMKQTLVRNRERIGSIVKELRGAVGGSKFTVTAVAILTNGVYRGPFGVHPTCRSNYLDSRFMRPWH